MSNYFSSPVVYYCKSSSIGTSSVAGNFTYADASTEGSMVTASVLMFVLAGFFFILNLFGGLSNVSAILSPRVRIPFTSLLSLFLPVMSYLFSEAKNTAKELALVTTGAGGSNASSDLPFMAGVILTWMLLVELIRKKVDEIAMKGYSGTIHRAGRVVWLGSLVFLNIRSAGRKAVFGVLWVLCATKVVQRIAFTEVGKRSYTCGKNPWIITSYMSSTTSPSPPPPAQGDGDAMLKGCRYIVTGEEDARVEATADGYELKDSESLVTVGKIWEEQGLPGNGGDELKSLCLSFALFKLLRRRLEQLPEMSSEETSECRDIIFKGLYKSGKEGAGDTTAAAAAVFEVLNNEINFLSEYYHSVVPVVLASPFFFVANYFLLPVVVLCVCLMTIILCGGGDVLYAFRSIKTDNFTISSGIFDTTMCLLLTAHQSATAFFATINFAVTYLLYVIYIYEEAWEFFVFLLSNWFAVSLLCGYVGKHPWLDNRVFRCFMRCVLCVRRWSWSGSGSHAEHGGSLKQFSALNLRLPPLPLSVPTGLTSSLITTKPVPIQVQHSILHSLAVHCGYLPPPPPPPHTAAAAPPPPPTNDAAAVAAAPPTKDAATAAAPPPTENAGPPPPPRPLNNVRCVLERAKRRDVMWACEVESERSGSVAEVILTWHIATGLVEEKTTSRRSSVREGDDFAVATTLSRYCAYLVAFRRELLPDYQEKAENVFDAMKAELKEKLGCFHYYFSRRRAWANAIVNEKDGPPPPPPAKGKVVNNGVRLAWALKNPTTDTDLVETTTWKLLAEVWTELMIYVAPSNREDRIMAHKNVLGEGGEFITVLWALATHTGITHTILNNNNNGDLHEIAIENSQAGPSSEQKSTPPSRQDQPSEISTVAGDNNPPKQHKIDIHH